MNKNKQKSKEMLLLMKNGGKYDKKYIEEIQ